MSRQLDAAIAKSLGYEVRKTGDEWRYRLPQFGNVDDVAIWHVVSYYSTDGNAMLELDSEMRERGHLIEMEYLKGKYIARYYYLHQISGVGKAETEPLARALAAYKALTGREWSE